MGIILSSNGNKIELRNQVIDYIKDKKNSNPSFKVIDIGGGINTWADELVDAYTDINAPKTSSDKKIYLGDINEQDIWNEMEKDAIKYDFSICTHTLEDIRNPVFVIKKLLEVSKAGFIAVPNKHTEFSNIESNYWVGNSHHRWVFSLRKEETNDAYLFFVPKWPGFEYFNRKHQNWWVSFKRFFRLTNADKGLGSRKIFWIDKSIANHKNELGFIWEDSFKFEFLDYAHSTNEMIEVLYKRIFEREALKFIYLDL